MLKKYGEYEFNEGEAEHISCSVMIVVNCRSNCFIEENRATGGGETSVNTIEKRKALAK